VPRIAITKEDIPRIASKHPKMFQDWQNPVHPCFHAELRVILHLDPPPTTRVLETRAIGCSKRSCLCCTLWMASLDDRLGAAWITSGSHGKPYANWALPDKKYAEGDGRRSCVDGDVCTQIAARSRRAIDGETHIKLTRWTSDEHRSSSDEEANQKSRRVGWGFLKNRGKK
jgi:hypothetical protein